MPLTSEQKNIVIGHTEKCISDLRRKIIKILDRRDEFIALYGDKTGPMESDLTKTTLSELKTHTVTLSKLRSEFMNIESNILFELKKVEMEINRRG